MKKRARILELSFFASLLVCVSLNEARTQESIFASDKTSKLAVVLNNFARSKRISDIDLYKQLFDLVLENRAIAKGGVAPLGDERYIFLRENKNTLKWKSGEWIGLPRDHFEIIAWDGKRFVKQGHLTTSPKLIVIFTKDKVRYLDFEDKTAGYYAR